MIGGACLVGFGLLLGLAVATPLIVWWLEIKRESTEISKREQVNRNNRAFYRAIGEKFYPHRNADGSLSHFRVSDS
jgi:hypothetical protein